MMNSTKIAAELNDIEISKYYTIFLNAIATIARNFCASVIKNAGDCLIYYFPRISDSTNQLIFKDVLGCGITMISAHHAINAKLREVHLYHLSTTESVLIMD